MASANAGAVRDILHIEGPTYECDLAPLDILHPVVYACRLLVFGCASDKQRQTQIDALRKGIQGLAYEHPLLGGLAAPMGDGVQEIQSGPGIELLIKNLSSEMISFDKLADNDYIPEMLPAPLLNTVAMHASATSPFAALRIQYTSFTGGSIISWAMSHTVGDGKGTDIMMESLSKYVRLASTSDEPPEIVESARSTGVDRKPLREITSDVAFRLTDHPAYVENIKEPVGGTDHPFAPSSAETAILLRISAESLTKLKNDATPADVPFISTHDALAALMWRGIMTIRSRRSAKAQEAAKDCITKFYMPSDARKQVKLPAGYTGNAVYQLSASLPLSDLTSDNGLKQAASAIRKAISAATPETVTSYMAHLREGWVNWGFMQDFMSTGFAMGTDWTGGGLYALDWGDEFGPLQAYRYPGASPGGSCILPKRKDGSADIVVSVMQDEIEMLKTGDIFGKYVNI